MLILTRRTGETVMVGEDITFKVLSVRGTTVRIGFEAPPECAIYREEIYEKIKRQVREDPPPT